MIQNIKHTVIFFYCSNLDNLFYLFHMSGFRVLNILFLLSDKVLIGETLHFSIRLIYDKACISLN